MTNNQKKNGTSSFKKFYKNCVTNYYRKYSINIKVFENITYKFFIYIHIISFTFTEIRVTKP